ELLVRVALKAAGVEGTQATVTIETALPANSGKAVRRPWMLGTGGAMVLVIGVVVIGLTIRTRRAYSELASTVAKQVRAAAAALADARRLGQQRVARDVRAVGLFGSHRWSKGEEVWAESEALAAQEAIQYRVATARIESALSLDPTRGSLRTLFADLTFQRL